MRMAGTSSARSMPERSAPRTLFEASAPISRDEFWLRSASLRTSVAATAKAGREPARARAGARRFDGGVQGEQVRLIRDLLDDRDFVGDRFHRRHRFANGGS